MDDRGRQEWNGICHPCQKIGICATGNVYCKECQHLFCPNCIKLHKAHEAGCRHTLTSFAKIDEHMKTRNELDISNFKYDQFGNEERDLQKVKQSYIKAISSNHDHVNENYPDEMFCVKHREVLCQKCKVRRHSLCGVCISVRRASQVLIESGQSLRAISRLKNCHTVACNALKETKKEKEVLNSKETQILQQIHDLKNAMLRHINSLENKLIDNIYGTYGKSLRNLTKTENILTQIKHSSEEMLESFNSKMQEGTESSKFKATLECHSRSILFTKMIERINKYCDIDKLQDCLFNTEYTVESIIHGITSLGNLNIQEFNSQVPSILSSIKRKPINISLEADESEFSLEFVDRETEGDESYMFAIMNKYSQSVNSKTRWSNPEFVKYGIVSMQCLGNEILVLDRTSCSLILVDKFGNPLSTFGFKCIPWAMTMYDDTIAAVSIPGENIILLVDVEFGDLVLRKEIKCTVEPSAITGYQDNIFITSYPWSDQAAIYKIVDDGRIISTLEKDISGKRLFKAPLDITMNKLTEDIFVCDSALKIVISFNERLEQKFRIDLESMGHPSCLTLDSRGDIYICGKLSNVIYKVTIANKAGKIILTENDGLSRPQAICNIPEENSLCVLCARDNIFKIYKLD